ncbi:MAG: hypothetical protein E4H03_01480 [Myxococcales bacterium]|nr:MAG: hypothetical protein E4H03_01480 [Myxococcales bacterium]
MPTRTDEYPAEKAKHAGRATRPTRPPRGGVATAAKLAAMLVPVLVFAGALELALRALPRAIPLDLLEHFEPEMRASIAGRRKLTTKEDTVLVDRTDGGPVDRLWIYRPNVAVTHEFDEVGIVATVEMDDMGFCNPVSDVYTRTERFDLVTIGDSFTWCTNVAPQDTFTAEVSRSTGLTAYNLGMPARGLHEYLQLLERFGLEKKPRYVAMTVYEGNDFRDAFLYHEARVGAEASLAGAQCPFSSQAMCASFVATKQGPLGRSSYAYNFAASALWHLAALRRKSEIDFKYEVELADGTVIGMNSQNSDRDEVEFARGLADGSLETSIFDDALERFAALARERDFVPIVLYAPSAYTAYADIARFDDASVAQTMRTYSDTLRSYFARRTAELGLRYRDLTPALQAAAARSHEDSLLYFRTNVHFTQAGHALVARELADAIDG